MSKLNLEVKDIAVLTDSEIAMVSGAGGTLGCSRPCETTCNSDNCNTTTGNEGGCKPTSNGCECPKQEQ